MDFASESVRTCEPIRFEKCKGIGYNVTGMPNLAGNQDQDSAILQLNTFVPLIQYVNSSRLIFFLCSVYVPMCTEKVLTPIGPCRPLCESVKKRCERVLNEFGYPWAKALNCSKFPVENNRDHMCMEGPPDDDPHTLPPILKGDHRPRPTSSIFKNGNRNQQRNPKERFNIFPNVEHRLVSRFPTKKNPIPDISGDSDTPKQNYKPCEILGYVNYLKYTYINRTERCALLCSQDDAFTEDNKSFVNIWMAFWAGLCFVSTIFTIITFLMDSQRFRYPERPIIFMAMCFNIYSIAYIVRSIAGRNDIACDTDSQSGESILIQEGLENTDCAIVFLLLYYFGTASALWWVILTITWFLATACKWTHEAIELRSSYFHLAAWATPAIKTIIILVMRDVDADELTGICYVGNQNVNTLMSFAIAPQILFLLLGSSFLIAGFVSVVKSRREAAKAAASGSDNPAEVACIPPASIISTNGMNGNTSNNTNNSHTNSHSTGSRKGERDANNKLEVLMVRIGIFSLLYTVPATCIIACLLYEYARREDWYLTTTSSPVIGVFMLKVFMSLVVGITTGVWVCSTKTLASWGTHFRKFVGPKRGRKGPGGGEFSSALPPHHHYQQVPIKSGMAVGGHHNHPASRSIRTDYKCKRNKSDSETIV